MNTRAITDFLLDLYRAAQTTNVVQFPETALQLLKRLVDFDMALIGLISANDDGSIRGHWGHLHNEPLSVMEEWQALSARDDVVRAMLDNTGRSIIVHATTQLAEKNKAELLDFALRTRHMNILGMASDYGNGEVLGGLSLRRADPRAIFSAADQMFAEWIVPHFWEAVRINRSVFREKIADTVLEPLRGFCICDRQGLVALQDSSFEAVATLVFGGDQPYALPGRLRQALVAEKQPVFTTDEIVFRAQHLGRIIFISAAPVEKLQRLSAREREVARFYGTGLTHKEIADELQISASTVRRHIEALYAKLQINTKADLAFLIHAASGEPSDRALESLKEVLKG